jgi:cytoskeletal protein RodZ
MSELHDKLGELLNLERKRQGVSLEDIASELKIPEETLLHIEKGEADALPAELYFKLFTKSYAEFLGIDYAKTIEAIREEIGEDLEPIEVEEPRRSQKRVAAEKAPSRKKEKKKETTGDPDLKAFLKRVGIITGAIVVAFVILLVGYKMFFSDDTSSDVTETTPDQVAADAVETEDASATDAESYDWNVPAYAPADSIRLTLQARDASWATVLADGDTVLYRSLVAQRLYTVAAKYRLLVSIGVPRLVEVTLDGQPAYLASAETGRISRVEIDQTNRHKFASPPGARTQRRGRPQTTQTESVTIEDTVQPEATETVQGEG